jgi:NAD(P)-dependent dehydrogenase (short-subunit alcohol dehydrogenase family)
MAPLASSVAQEVNVAYAPLDLSGKVAIVIGGTSGIGLALTHGLAEAGADVIPTARRPEQVESAAGDVEARGRQTARIITDVTSRASLEAALSSAVSALGHVDILVNCAGRTVRKPTLDLPEADWQAILDTNLTGTLRACQIFGRHMVERGWGRIINVASLASFVAFYEVAAYSASKAAVASLTKSLALELGPRGVNVNGIAPGFFPTDLNRALLEGTARGNEVLMRTPLKRFGRVEELAGAAVFLASDSASFVNGEILVVDGGFLASGTNQ